MSIGVRKDTKNEESTLLSDTGLVVELEHLKTKMRLIRKPSVLTRIFPTLDLIVEENTTWW
jgi:hypothetical protein